ncbi:hypothetical protein ABBQ32_007443 [Trebouxia sp. C0010 RCD-2024]
MNALPPAGILSSPMLVSLPWTGAPADFKSSITLHRGQVGTLRSCFGVQRITASWSGFGSHNKPDPIWVDTHKGIPNLIAETKPAKPCKVCLGHGKVVCGTCDGKGRTNGLQHRMLPRGMWPKWCTSCRGSGLWYCQSCQLWRLTDESCQQLEL